MAYEKINGVDLAVEEKGKGTLPPIVFVHGWTADMHRWDDQFAFFAKRRRVIRFDLRGHGESEKCETGMEITQLADDLYQLLKKLKVKKAVVVGHSMGGMTVQQFTLYHPEMVDRLILVDTTAKMVYSPAVNLQMNLAKIVPFKAFVKINITRAFKNTYPKKALNAMIALSQQTPKNVVMPFFDAMQKFDLLDKIPAIKAKTLIVHGLYDIQLPLHQAVRIAAAISDATMKIIDSGHELPLEQPEKLTAAMNDFLNS
ncbi:MAG: alpha/beta fold hydrolase [Spirochaetota bacterium]